MSSFKSNPGGVVSFAIFATLLKPTSCELAISRSDFMNARTAQDFIMAGFTAMAISYAINSAPEESKGDEPRALDGDLGKLEKGYIKEKQGAQTAQVILLSSMLIYSTFNAICLICANESYSGFESEYFRLFKPFSNVVSPEAQEQICYIAAVLHAGFGLTSAFHMFSSGYMCNDSPLNTPVWALRIMAISSPMIGRSIVTEVAGLAAGFVINESCKSVVSKNTARIRKNDALIKEIAV